jgi:hypothetical protein
VQRNVDKVIARLTEDYCRINESVPNTPTCSRQPVSTPCLSSPNATHKLAPAPLDQREKRLVRRSPSLNQVRDWVDQASNLPPVITY